MEGGFGRYALKRLAGLFCILWAITFISFGMMRAAGSDAVEQKLENRGVAVSEEQLASARAELGLDKPFLTQYGLWLEKLAAGDMGRSYVTGRSVTESFMEKLPATMLLAAVALALTVLVSLPLGVLAAVRQDKWLDYLIRALSFVGSSLPNFFVALLLIYFFAVRLQLLPVLAGRPSLTSVILPALTLIIAMSAKYIRQVRAAVLEELGQDYVLGARARGVSMAVILRGSVLRSALVTLVTLLMLSLGSLLGGTAIVESIFMWDGVGRFAVDAISMRDYPVIQAYVIWMALIYVALNFLADLSYGLLDPRIRLGGGRA